MILVMTKYKLEFFIPHLPPPVNVFMRLNRYERGRIFEEFYSYVYFAAKKQNPKMPLKKCKLTLVRFGTKFLDYDGLVGSFKPVVDGLTKSKIIIDDKFEVTGPWLVDQRIVKKDQVGISIIVEGEYEE